MIRNIDMTYAFPEAWLCCNWVSSRKDIIEIFQQRFSEEYLSSEHGGGAGTKTEKNQHQYRTDINRNDLCGF